MAREIQLNDLATGEPDLELNLGEALPRWAPGFNALKACQDHVYTVPTPTGMPLVLFVQRIWQN